MSNRRSKRHARLLCGVASAALILSAGAAQAQDEKRISIPPQSLASALHEFGVQSGHQVLFTPSAAASKTSPGSVAEGDMDAALAQLLTGTGMSFRRAGDVFLIEQEGGSSPQGASAGDVDALIVTAQKREENIQDVPIAISAFSQEELTTRQVAGGPDLMTQVPNFTFTKTNFTGYSIQIRGIGTQAISATTDPAVAVAFNNTPFVRNRFFEQEFYDLERVEVLRGPQGTLYGRNATAGVVNIIPAKPTFSFQAKGSADVANYSSKRLEGMVNTPLVEDKVALRLAGAWTKRDGFVMNEITGEPIDGRDLWSTRVSLRVDPTDTISANLVWEHFQENDDRLRSGKQLCKKDAPSLIGGVQLPVEGEPGYAGSAGATFSLGCAATSMYSPEAFQTPNGFSLPYYSALGQVGAPVLSGVDPYASTTQSSDLRVIESTLTPQYRAKSDLAQLQLSWDITPELTLSSETVYSADRLFSFQDYNRFNTASGVFVPGEFYIQEGVLDENGVFCDPQLGCADRLVAADVSTADSNQFSQEFRLASDFDGPFNFSMGANFLRYDTTDKYYVFINMLTLFSTGFFASAYDGVTWVPGVTDNSHCFSNLLESDPEGIYNPIFPCKYIDPNPIGALNDLGRNYFLSKNPYRLISYAMFGEAQYELTPDLKLTAGLRWTVDKKRAPIIPSWLLAGQSYGLPVQKIIEQEWNEPTGRVVIDWKPNLSFTDDTMLYASFSHGYKAGGANPPLPVNAFGVDNGLTPEDLHGVISATQPPTFGPEFINAFEVGAKNTVLDGRVTINATAFYYDYEGYQISQVINRSAVNSNFDAEVYGAELEVDWRPLENLRLGFKGGYEHTSMADGSQGIDIMDRAAGDPDWIVTRPFPAVPSNCILPKWLITWNGNLNVPNASNGHPGPCAIAYGQHNDPVTELPYVKDPQVTRDNNSIPGSYWDGYPGFDPLTAPNNGEGIFKDLSGNELPNAPHFTGTLTADFTLPLPNEWLLTLHGDFYYQSEAWTRIFNTEGYDKLKAYTNVNFAALFINEDAGWRIMAYVKNVMDRDSITGAFLNSDDTGLTTNVFLTEPRLYGVRVTKEWTGEAFWMKGGRPPGEPYPFTLELGGGPSRFDAQDELLAPDWIDTYIPSAGFPLWPQEDALDWGDDREVKLTYTPNGRGGWSLSAGARFGRANATRHGENGENEAEVCTVFQGQDVCRPGPLNWATDDVRNREDFTVADFMIGKEVGIGVGGEGGSSAIGVGLRYAALNSRTTVDLLSDPDHYFPPDEDFIKYDRHWHDYDVALDAARSFTGVGPQASWEAEVPLIGDNDTGRASLNWSIGGGVLFGKQKTDLRNETTGTYLTGTYLDALANGGETITPINDLVARHETKSVTVPNLGANLGLSYAIDRIKVGAGYRWERYFDAIDGGIETRQTFDRTIDGPYFKVSVGFGG